MEKWTPIRSDSQAFLQQQTLPREILIEHAAVESAFETGKQLVEPLESEAGVVADEDVFHFRFPRPDLPRIVGEKDNLTIHEVTQKDQTPDQCIRSGVIQPIDPTDELFADFGKIAEKVIIHRVLRVKIIS